MTADRCWEVHDPGGRGEPPIHDAYVHHFPTLDAAQHWHLQAARRYADDDDWP